MKLFLVGLLSLSRLQVLAEILGLACISLAGFLISVPAGLVVTGLSLLLLGNVRVSQ